MDISAFPRVLQDAALKRGAVFRMKMTRQDGIAPKHGNDKLKRFVVLSLDSGRIVAASLIINSDINRNLYNLIAPYQHEIHEREYAFLEHDSYIDGFTLHEFNTQRILSEAEFIGTINEDDIRESVDRLIETGKVKPVTLKRFGLKHS